MPRATSSTAARWSTSPATTGSPQGRGAVPLHPRGLIPGPLVPQPRRPRRPAPPLARHGRQPTRPRDHRPGLLPRSSLSSSPCLWCRTVRLSGSREARLTLRAWSASAATTIAYPSAGARRRDPDLRGRPADRRRLRARRPQPARGRAGSLQGVDIGPRRYAPTNGS
jgi:hypothetical protein